MKDFETLRSELDSIIHSGNEELISYFEENIDSIRSIDPLTNPEASSLRIQLEGDYGMSLCESSNYRESIEPLKIAIEAYEELHHEKDQSIKLPENYLERLRFCYAVSLNYTGKRNESYRLFKNLTAIYPNKDVYQTWLYGIEYEKIRAYAKPIYYGAAIYIVFDLLARNYLNAPLKMLSQNLLILILIIIVAFELYSRFLKKKNCEV